MVIGIHFVSTPTRLGGTPESARVVRDCPDRRQRGGRAILHRAVAHAGTRLDRYRGQYRGRGDPRVAPRAGFVVRTERQASRALPEHSAPCARPSPPPALLRRLRRREPWRLRARRQPRRRRAVRADHDGPLHLQGQGTAGRLSRGVVAGRAPSSAVCDVRESRWVYPRHAGQRRHAGVGTLPSARFSHARPARRLAEVPGAARGAHRQAGAHYRRPGRPRASRCERGHHVRVSDPRVQRAGSRAPRWPGA